MRYGFNDGSPSSPDHKAFATWANTGSPKFKNDLGVCIMPGMQCPLSKGHESPKCDGILEIDIPSSRGQIPEPC